MVTITPIDIVGYGIVIFVLVELIILAIKLFSDYKKTNYKMSLNFGIVFISLAFAVICLILEKIFLGLIDNYLLAVWFGWIARIGVSSAGTFIASVAFDFTYPEKKKGLMILVIILFGFFIVFNYFAMFGGYPYTYEVDDELVHGPITLLINYALLIPSTNISSVVFFYFSIVNRDNPTASRRSFWMGFAVLIFSIAYAFEVGPIAVIIAVPMRAIYIVSATILYVTFTRTPKD